MTLPTPDELLALAEDGLKLAQGMGADAAEIYLHVSHGVSYNVTGDYAIPKRSREEGIGVRVGLGARLGQSGATGLSRDALRTLVRHALDAARRVPDSTRFDGFARPATLPAPTPVHPALAHPDVARLGDDVARVSDALVAPDVTYRGVALSSWRARFAVANTEGVRAWDEHAAERIAVEARVTRGTTERSAQDMAYGRGPVSAELDIEAHARDAVARARSSLDASPLPGAVDEVVLTSAPAAQVIQLFTPALSGKRAQARQSPLAEKLGAEVAPGTLTIRDLPRGPGGIHHARVDHEGNPTAPLTLLDAGRVSGFLYDEDSARKAQRASTGHGLRSGGVAGGVGIKPVNLDVAAGAATLDEILEGTQRAVLVNEPLMGSFVANDATGDFSLVAPFAFLVEGGKVRGALPPTTVGGNVHKLLRELRALSRERREFLPGTFPSLRAGGVSCAT